MEDAELTKIGPIYKINNIDTPQSKLCYINVDHHTTAHCNVVGFTLMPKLYVIM